MAKITNLTIPETDEALYPVTIDEAVIVNGDAVLSDKIGNYDNHLNNTSNPHNVTKAQIGLGEVINTGDSSVPVPGGNLKFTTGGAYTELEKKRNNSVEILDYSATTYSISSLAGNSIYNLGTLTTLTITNFGDDQQYESLIYFTAGENITVTFPDSTKYIATPPTFFPNEQYVISIMNGIVVVGVIN